MKVFKVTLRAYNGYKDTVIPATTIAGGLVYGMVANKDKGGYNVMFTNFLAVEGKDLKSFDRVRVTLDRIVNHSTPYLSYKLISNKGPYVDFQGYVIAEDYNSVMELFRKYLVFVGNNFTVLDVVGEPKTVDEVRELCVHNVPVVRPEDLGKYRNNLRIMRIQRFFNFNYLDASKMAYYFDVNEGKFKSSSSKYLLLCTFKAEDNDKLGSFYDKFSNPFPPDMQQHFKEYLRMGTGVIAPCT